MGLPEQLGPACPPEHLQNGRRRGQRERQLSVPRDCPWVRLGAWPLVTIGDPRSCKAGRGWYPLLGTLLSNSVWRQTLCWPTRPPVSLPTTFLSLPALCLVVTRVDSSWSGPKAPPGKSERWLGKLHPEAWGKGRGHFLLTGSLPCQAPPRRVGAQAGAPVYATCPCMVLQRTGQ